MITSGCALFVRVEEQDPKKLLGKTCLSASGQSRIHFRQNRHLVRFESVLQQEEGVWYVALDVPGRGQELVQVNYLDDVPTVQGRFYERLFHQARGENETVREWFEEFVDFLIFIPRLLDPKILDTLECGGGECIVEGETFYYQVSRHGITLTRPSELENVSLVFEVSGIDEQQEWFERITFRLNLTDRAGPEANPAQLFMFLEECRI